jgi:hypothetical protein
MQDGTHQITGDPNAYPFYLKNAVEGLLYEAWNCLRTDGLIMDGRNGWLMFTRAGEEASASDAAYERVRAAKAFPKSLLHPSIAEPVWSALLRGDLDDAVFKSFRAVEEAVRAAGKFPDTDRPVPMMRKGL